MARAKKPATNGWIERIRAKSLVGYRRATRDPIYALLVLTPLVIAYEMLAASLRPPGAFPPRLIAPSAIRNLFAWLGATGAWLPAITLIATLVGMQLSKNSPSKPRLLVVPVMILEGIALSAPLIVISVLLLYRGSPTAIDIAGITGYRSTLAVGAAIYEEFVFRLILISALVFLFRDLMRVPSSGAISMSVAVAAAAFSACHFPPVGSLPFGWIEFFFYLSAGAYLSLLYLSRGLPIAVVCHAAYNIALLAW